MNISSLKLGGRFRNSRGPFRGLEISREKKTSRNIFDISWKKKISARRRDFEKIVGKFKENGTRRRRKKFFFFLKTTISNWYWKNLYSRSRNEWKKKKKKKVYGILREELI